ncbi:MAG: TIR domain-containing protein [Anaerolineae bacterium]|nr:TIR domain-containing protein [Anaerolineae bacterium]
MADVFISYSRHNIAFARRLFDALQQSGRDSWIDWDDIPMSTEWWKAIQEGIEAANGFVLIITPDSLSSPVCALEIAHAITNHKRIIPVVHADTDISAAYGKLAAVKPSGFLAEIIAGRDLLEIARKNWSIVEGINWLFFRENDSFEASLKRLIEVVETDFARVRLHTRLLIRAGEWREKGFDHSTLLSGSDLREAERWLKREARKPPQATEAHRAFIRASLHQEAEEAAERQQQIDALNAASQRAQRQSRRAGAATVIAALLVVALTIAALVAGTQINDANRQIATATVAQGAALDQVATATVFQGLALLRADAADTRVAIAGETLTPIPGTLTQAALLRLDAEQGQHILNELNAVSLNIRAGIGVSAQIARMDLLVEQYPENPLAFRARGLVRADVGDLEGALADYSRAIVLDPTFVDALLSRGHLLLRLGRPAEAEADFTQIIALEPGNSTAYYNRGVARATQNAYDLALADYTRTLQIDETNAEAYNNRGAAYYALAKYELAAQDFSAAIAFGLDDENTYRSLNLALERLQTPTLDLRTVFPVTPSPTASATTRATQRYVFPATQPSYPATAEMPATLLVVPVTEAPITSEPAPATQLPITSGPAPATQIAATPLPLLLTLPGFDETIPLLPTVIFSG